MRVLFFGMLGTFSLPPLKAIQDVGFNVVGVIVPSDNSSLSIRELKSVSALQLTPTQPNIVHLAWQHQIPVYEVNNLKNAETQQLLAELSPNVACVACFNKRIPKKLLDLPKHGFLNVHPSLLPEFRGPAPLFWTFRAGIQQTGVTIHCMDAGLDTGDIAQQAPLTLPEGISGQEADMLTGKLGGELLVKTLNQISDDTFSPIPQPTGKSSQPWPQTLDFRIPVSWSARRAYNFIRGTAEFGQPFVIELEDEEIVAKTAVSYQPTRQLNHPIQQTNNETWIQFSPGALHIIH